MDELEFQQKLQEMLDNIKGLDVDADTKARLNEQAKKTAEHFRRGKEVMKNLQDSLDVLRVNVKYLVFDLEATRRENQQLRDLLHSRDIDEHEEDQDEQA